ncbi:BREX-2 system phosphatase PglZ [Thiohalocapsa marina]|uniref:BREX-2 system phosphatase PglZ n=1 Tax=Thiohalocapsa marina TaxID=424902 RepID=A0A5M8FH84_9GAMM|nr:BREX-2 system phosphatase PglZ [Thiohalocapsa marina]KAA6183784.1 BREX-2 system phosphatase PglZ [Thiohalocapsa marina]
MVDAVIPNPVLTQLKAIFNAEPGADPVALVWPEPIEPIESVIQVAGREVRLVFCPSELALRERLVGHQPNERNLVLLTPFDESRLGKDVLARLWGNEPKRISPWRTLEQLLQVRQIDPRLTVKHYRWIADALLNSYEAYRGAIRFGEVLDFDQAWQALALGWLGYTEAEVDLDLLLRWSLDPATNSRVKALPAEVLNHLGDWLKPRLGDQFPVVLSLWQQGHAGDMAAVGLICSMLYRPGLKPSQSLFLARGRLSERYLGGARLTEDTLTRFGQQTADFLVRQRRQSGAPSISACLTLAEQILASLDLADLAIDSDLLPMAFGQRLDRFAKALQRAIKGKPLIPAQAALRQMQRHQLADARRDQVRRAELAVRACAWLNRETTPLDSAAGMIQDFVREGGFVDWARSHVWLGDEHEGVSAAYRALNQRLTERREQMNEGFGQHLAALAQGDSMGQGICPVERALDEILVPLAKQRPVLLLVLDGMSQAVYRELSDDLVRHTWVELQREGTDGPGCLLAALPSITRVSRYSLLAGTLGEGVANDEKKAFAGHQGLKSLASNKYPPTLFHKSDLQQPGSGALSSSVREVIAGQEHRVVAAVINAIDDDLGGGAQVALHWSVAAVHLLRQILEAARESGRLLVMTSDHGHVLDHDMTYRATESEAERFKPGEAKVESGEVRVRGQRVIQPGHAVVLPWSEKIRYAAKKKGYHGGASLQELVIPLGVYRNGGETDPIEHWTEVPHRVPDWWQWEDAREGVAEAPPAAVPSTAKQPEQRQADLFAALEPKAATDAESDWIGQLLASSVYQQMKARHGRSGIDDAQLERLLRHLSERGGQQMLGALGKALGIPGLRINGFLANVQKLLNLDGYPVLSIDRAAKSVRLNVDSLKTQFEL